MVTYIYTRRAIEGETDFALWKIDYCVPRVHKLIIVAYTVIRKSTKGNILVIFSKQCDDFEILLDSVLRLSTVLREKTFVQDFVTSFCSGPFAA